MVASVLVIAVDQNIEFLVGKIVALAGHRPVLDSTMGAAGESIRRVRPDVSLLDDRMGEAVLKHCLDACDEVAAEPVLISATETDDELAEQARALSCLHFALSGSPRLIDPVLSNALAAKQSKSDHGIAPAYSTRDGSPAHPALCTAIASIARARALTIRANAAVAENRQLRDAVASALHEARRSRASLRAAVGHYAEHLKMSSVPVESLDEMVSSALTDCATIIGAEGAVALVASDSRRWARAVYEAA